MIFDNKAASKGVTPRKNIDRRSKESCPPSGCCERRKRAERRLPTVDENAVSEAEWFTRMAIFRTKQRAEHIAQLEVVLGLNPSQPEDT